MREFTCSHSRLSVASVESLSMLNFLFSKLKVKVPLHEDVLTLTNLSSKPVSVFAPAVALRSPSPLLLSHCDHYPCCDCHVMATIPTAAATTTVPLCCDHHCCHCCPAALLSIESMRVYMDVWVCPACMCMGVCLGVLGQCVQGGGIHMERGGIVLGCQSRMEGGGIVVRRRLRVTFRGLLQGVTIRHGKRKEKNMMHCHCWCL